MRKYLIIIGILLALHMAASNTINIPIRKSNDASIALSIPDPTDPNQFRASLTGNMLVIETPEDVVSFVVIQENESERRNEDYFYAVSFGTVSCPITRAGLYAIRIGYWSIDYVGYLRVTRVGLYDLNGRLVSTALDNMNEQPAGYYIIRLETNMGTTTTKFYKQQ